MTEIATVDWFGRWETSVFSENTANTLLYFLLLFALSASFIFHEPLIYVITWLLAA